MAEVDDQQTPGLRLPYILAAQAQKHVTHNEALVALDAVVQLGVGSVDANAPPASPAEGDRHIVGTAPTGAWADHADAVAAWIGGAWQFHEPREGWLAIHEGSALVYRDGGWVELDVGDPTRVDQLGIGTDADANNRLAVRSPATLLTAENGSHRLVVNKDAPAETGSVVFQTAYSGRAEFGLTGTDDFTVKVSPDGNTWRDAIRVEASTGIVSFPAQPIARERLFADRIYYVRPDGSNGASGRSEAEAFANLGPIAAILGQIDPSGFRVIVNVAPGSYTGFSMSTPLLGFGRLRIRGTGASPTDVQITGNTALGATASGCVMEIENVQLNGSRGIYATFGGQVYVTGPLAFGACALGALVAADDGFIEVRNRAIELLQDSQNFVRVSNAAGCNVVSCTINLADGIAFTAFVNASRLARTTLFNLTFNGSATGKKFAAVENAVIFAPSVAIPGNQAGTFATGAQVRNP